MKKESISAKHRKKSRVLGLLISAALCAVVFSFTGCGGNASGTGSTAVTAAASEPASASDSLTRDTVTVSAKGNSYAVPDRAELRFGVRTQAETALEAQEQNSKDVDAVIKTLKKNGVKEENIQTTWYDVSPQYDWNTGNGDKIVSYNVSSSLSVKNVNIEDAGTLITACTNAGANEFNGVSYSCTEYDKYYGEALQKAVEASKEKAALLAEAAGRTLGKVTVITEGYQDMTYAANTKSISAMDSAGAAEESSGASLMPGEAEITANITVTYVLD